VQLAQFILEEIEGILQDWEDFAHAVPIARSMQPKQLRNHAAKLLRTIAAEIVQPQSDAQEKAKAKGESDAPREASSDSAGQEHAARRLEEGFSLPELVSEYRALRASVTRRWRESGDLPGDALDQLVRFNEAIDQSLAESVERFSGKLDRARELFMGALGHDLRGPLHVVLRGATYLKDSNISEQRRADMAGFVIESAEHMQRMIEDLLDVARTKLGGALPIELKPTDAAVICSRVITELRAQNPEREFELTTSGDLLGVWDAGRIEQVFSNLVSNAVQHGDRDKPITLSAQGDQQSLVVRVHNHGEPVPERLLDRIFEPMVRGDERDRGKAPSAHMGLGLYIACTVVRAHGGSIRVQSSDSEGTTFEVSLPKKPAVSQQS
jgi:signal transduction histidine kinase